MIPHELHYDPTLGRSVISFMFSLAVGLAGAVLLLCVMACVAAAQDVALAASSGWPEIGLRLGFAVLVSTAAIEALRWVVPGWGRERGADGKRVPLPSGARKILLLTVLAIGQAQAWAGALVLPDGWSDSVTLAGAGLVVSAGSVVLNEVLWKRIMREVRARVGGRRQ